MIAAIVPAAGQSRRMGRPKLTLPLAEGGSVIERVVRALRQGGAEPVVVVTPPPAQAGSAALIEQATRAGAQVVPVPETTSDMRASFEVGLEVLDRARLSPTAVLLAPGDSVGLTPELVALVVSRSLAEPDRIILPEHNGRRGHPLALPWNLARAVRDLPDGVGINALRDRYSNRLSRIEAPDPLAFEDLDTPEDYRRWSEP